MLIAVIGGICSGKSEVMAVLRDLGAHTVKTDDINRQMLAKKDYIAEVGAVFPSVIVGGAVDKAALRSLIMADSNAREKLNELAHPRIFAEVKRISDAQSGVMFVENPLIISTNSADLFDEIWCVLSDKEERLVRLQKRDNVSQQEAERTMLAQSAEERAHEIADVIITNRGDKEALAGEVKRLYESRMAR
ncbi:MAG: dephospho-CoA kinase [Bacillota bacterium]